MRIKARVIISNADDKRWVIEGVPRPLDALPVGDATFRLAGAEEYLSRLLGLTVKIETEAA